MTERRRLVVVGAGGFGPEIAWAARRCNSVHPTFDLAGHCDDDPAKRGGQLDGLEVLGRPEDVAGGFASPPLFVCAVGNNERRAALVRRLLALGWVPATVIDPSVHVADGVVVGDGTYVGAGSILAPHCRIGEHVIINHHCSVGHDSRIDSFSSLAPGVRVSGACVVGESATVGSNAVIAPGKSVGQYATLGACSFAMTNIPDRVTAVGVPARVIGRKQHQSEAVDALTKLQRIFRDAFDDPSLIVTLEFSMSTYPDWDSVATVGIVLAVEEAFGIRFTTDEVANTHSVADLLKVVEARTR